MIRLMAMAVAAAATPALAVGLGPLAKSGVTDGPRKGFYLTVINPYRQVETYTLTALATDSEREAARVAIFPAKVAIGGGGTRKVLVVADGLTPGETYQFRVCAEKPPVLTETVHARVCSKLSARRVRS